MAKAKRKAANAANRRILAKKPKAVDDNDDVADNNNVAIELQQQDLPPNQRWGARLRDRQRAAGQNVEAGPSNSRDEHGEEPPDVQMEGAEIMDILQKVFVGREVAQLPTLSPGAGLYAMANYAIEHENTLPKKKMEKPELPEDMLEPTFVTLEEAIQRDNNFQGKLLDAFLEDFREHFESHFSRRRIQLNFDRELCGRFLHQHFPLCRTPLIEQLVDEFGGRYSTAAWVCFFVESGLGFLMRRYFLHTDQFEWVIKSAPLPSPRKRRANWLPDPTKGPLADSISEYRNKVQRFRADYAPLFVDGFNRLVPNAEEIKSNKAEGGDIQIECLVCTREFPLCRSVSCSNLNPQHPTGHAPLVDLVNTGQQQPCSSSSSSTPPENDSIHRFCIECLVGHARAATQEMPLAEGGVGLKCMAGDCPNAILFSDCRFYIPPMVRRHLNARILEESLGEAKIQHLERCQECNYAVIIETPPEELRVFSCQKCRVEHCRLCQRPWTELHFGRRCNEVETEQEQKKHQFENMLSQAIIRRCHRCSLPFVKSEGCNRMYCRCGATQCYICRKSNIAYSHFCQHFRQPGQKKCTQCKLPCLLWELEEKADRKAIAHVVQQAEQMGIALEDRANGATAGKENGTG